VSVLRYGIFLAHFDFTGLRVKAEKYVVILKRGLVQFAQVEQFGEVIKMEHRLVLAVFAKKRHVLTQVHVLEMIRNKAPVTPLDTFTKFF
jgi:hypothetical protein